MASDVSIRVGVDGAAEFRTAIRSMNSQMRELDSEMRALTSGINSLDDAEAAAGQRMSILQRQAQLTEQRIQTLTQQYDRQVAKLEELGRAQEEAMRSGNEAEITRTTNAYNRQQQAVNDLSRQLNNARSDMNRFEQNIRDVENGTDRLTESFRDAGNAADDMGNGLTDAFAGGAVAGAVQSLISGIGSLIDSTMEYQRIMAALETSSANAGYSAEQTEASYRQLYSVLGDEQSSATALSNLQALGLSQDELTTMIDGTIGAWAKYGDSIPIDSLAEAINETAKVGTVTGTFADVLNWAGTSEDEFNEKLAACNTEQERTQLIMDELSKQGLPGMADAYRENNSALVETYDAQAKMNDALSQTAEAIMPLAATITGGLASALDALQPAIQFIVDNIETVVAGIGAFMAVMAVGKIVSFVKEIGSLGGAIMSLAGGPIGLIATAVAAAVAAIVYLWNNCEGFRQALTTIGEGIKTVVLTVVDFVKNLITGLPEFFSGILEGIKGAWASVTEFFTTLFSTAVETIKQVWSTIVEFFTGIWEGIKGVFSTVVDFFTGIFNSSKEATEQAWSTVVGFFSGIWDGIKNAFSSVVDFFTGIFNSSKEATEDAWGTVVDFFAGIWDGIQGVFSGVADTLGGFFSSAASAVESAWSGITSFFSGIWNQIKGVFSNAASTFLSIGRNIVSGIKNGISNGWNSLVSWLKGKLSGLVDTVLSFFGINSPSRLFADIGENLMEGMAVGIEKNTSSEKAITDQMNNVVDTATASIEDAENALAALQSRGAPEGLLNDISDMDANEAVAYTEQLLSLTDDLYNDYIALWEKKRETAQEVARKFYQDEMDALVNEFVDKIPGELSTIKDEMRSIGVNSIQGMINGMQSMSGMLADAARSVVNNAISAMQSAADIHSPSKKTENLIGKPMAQGVEVGFLVQMREAQRVMAAAIMAPVNTISREDLYGATAGVVNGMAAAAPVAGMTSTIIIPVNLNGRQIAEAIYNPLQQVKKQRGY